jgi:hypothetical protein
MKIHKLQEPLLDKAEGDCAGFPYTTELASINGVSIHFWAGDKDVTHAQMQAALSKARAARDIVSATWSTGSPMGYWAHQDIK